MNARRNRIKSSTRRAPVAVSWDPGNLQAWWPDSLVPTPPPADWLLMETWVDTSMLRPRKTRSNSNPFPEVSLISAED